MQCNQCPRRCNADRRDGHLGFCGVGDAFSVARIAPHLWEEPPISGKNGSGTVFFCGCNLRCVFCQNRDISRADVGTYMSEAELSRAILDLQERGVHNVNLVTPTHYTEGLARLLTALKPRLHVPVVWNSSAYESPDALRQLEGLVDIYLPDVKYFSSELSSAYSAAPDYAEHATAALAEMVRQTGRVRFDKDGLMTRGVMVRHLVLPGSREDSKAVLDRIAQTVDVADIRLSLMRQYTPDFAPRSGPKALLRRVTSFEYDSVMEHAQKLGFEGYFQRKEAATAAYTPDFSLLQFPRN